MLINNENIINNFKLLLNDTTKNRFEKSSYNKIINIISNLEYDITKLNIEKLKDIKYIGKSTIQRIEDILTYGNLPEFDNINKSNIINKLKTIHGIGIVKALKLYNNSITYENINNNLNELTIEQQIGVKYKDDIIKKIPKIEINKFNIKIKKIFHKLDNNLIYNICGSYRRCKEYSGDIDILITNTEILLVDIIKYLHKKNILIDDLTINGTKKYMGICKLSNKIIGRRIDIRLISLDSYYYALLYFTGSDETNKYMRNIAKQNNWKLNEYSLIDNNNNKFIVNSEEDIFKLLHIDYINPIDR